MSEEMTPAKVRDVVAGRSSVHEQVPGSGSISTITSSVASVFGSEPICPNLSGVTFPSLPSAETFGEIVDDALENVSTLANRVTNPPSAKDIMKEISTGVASAADKISALADTAVAEVKLQYSAEIAAAHDLMMAGRNTLEQAIFAARSGSLDISSLGQDIMDLPAAVVEGAFAGMKSAQECLLGPSGGPEAAFRKSSANETATLASGHGASSILMIKNTGTALPVPTTASPLELAEEWSELT